MSGDALPSPTATSAKPDSYYAQARADLVERLPAPAGRVLDVGCGEGGAAAHLRQRGATHLIGIEIEPDAAERARQRYDEVATGAAEHCLADLSGPFDSILCYDVLEHLVDPWALVAALAEKAAPGGRLHLSIPNARHFSLLRDLLVRGTFGYTLWGHRDATHLRWFTRQDLVRMIEGAGWTVDDVGHAELRPLSRLLARLTRGLSAEFLVHQWYLLAHREVR
jgi:2-polyprenyl-3-methyl-5-hydroxy-6-metoxy-1,4-benzoquinol methylase